MRSEGERGCLDVAIFLMMNTDSLSFAVNAVNNLITASLNKKHYKQQLVDVHKVSGGGQKRQSE